MSEEQGRRTFKEEVEVAGTQLVERVKELAKESNTRRVIIKNTEGEELITIPLTFGVVAGGILTLYAPLLAGLGAIAALVSRVRLEVIREEEEGTETAQADPAEPGSPQRE
ncbi:MAG: DUF4342 domain-containing protein [Deinococcota bacterium]|jgi:hypothetical protein|nr:DUF4342 domain-containing protein [Deinococcota bacterium]